MRYTQHQIILHWLSAIIIIWAIFSGFTVGFMPTNSNIKTLIAEFNVSITILFIPLFIFRVYLKFKHPNPAYTNMNRSRILLAINTHRFIYILIFVILGSGVTMLKDSYNIFNLFTLHPVVESKYIRVESQNLHIVSSIMLSALVFLHVGAATVHLIKRNEIFSRMTFAPKEVKS